VETHIHCFCVTRLDVVVDDAEGRAVVGLHRGGRLLVSHFFEDLSLRNGLTSVDVQCAEFGFGGR
jgi:hypothetical protein